MLQDTKRFISYICPHCRQSVIVERSAFSIAASPVHIKCPCGKSELTVEFMPQRVNLTVPCVVCGRDHLVSCPSHAFLREKALAFSCAASGLDCCYVGEEGPVYAATARLERAVDKLDKIGPEKVGAALRDDCGLAPEQVEEILAFISITGSNEKVLEALARYEGKNELFDQGLQELRSVTAYLGQFGVPEENFAVDLTIARGLDYYTGTVYETTLLDHPEIGSVCSGGRYDNLAGYYTDRQLPGVGISIGLTRLFYVLGEQGLLNPALPTAPADALVLPMTANAGPAISVATCLREAGIRTQVYLEQKKFKQKMSYADKLGIPYAVLLGEDELREGKCSVKDLATGEQVTVTPEEAARRIAQGMAEKNRGAVILEK